MPRLPSFAGNDSLYCEASHTSDEVLCYGSDDEYYESPLVRISCLEKQARRYLEGRRPFLLSASLRGPFDKGSWKNPWSGRGSTARSGNNTSSHSQRRRPTTAQGLPNQNAPEPTSAPTLELGATPENTVYTDDLPPVSKKRAASADWLRRTNLKRMRSHDAVPAAAPSPTLRRGRSADYSRSLSVSTEARGMGMGGDEALFSERRCFLDTNANKIQNTGGRKTLAKKPQRPVPSAINDRSMSASADLPGQDASVQFHESIASTMPMPEGPERNGAAWHTRQTVKVEQEDSDVFKATGGNDSTSKSNTAEAEVETRLTDDNLNSPSILPTGPDGLPDMSNFSLEQNPAVEESSPPLSQEQFLAVEEHTNDEASQQLLDGLNDTDTLGGSTRAANIKSETRIGELALQAQPCLPSVETELPSRSPLGADTDAADSVGDTTRITWHTGNDSLMTGVAERCDEATLPKMTPSLSALEKASRPADITTATSHATSSDVRSWAVGVDALAPMSLTNLPTSPCSPEHAEPSLYKMPGEQMLEPTLGVPSSGAPPSTPDTKQSSLPTPDMSVSIKSFRRFRSPTPTPPPRRRPNKPGQPRSILSYPRRNPSGVPGSARKDRHVRFVLPDDNANDGVPFAYTYDLPDADAEDVEGVSKRSQAQGQYGSSRTASPPPQNGALTGTLPSEVEKFQEHYASVANRTKQAIHRADSPELRNCGPQQCSVTALPGTGSPLQEQRTFGQSQAAVELPADKLPDDAAGGGDKENQTNALESRYSGDGDEEEEQPVDDVQEVLDNLDDFLGMWSIEAELAQARSEHV